MVCPRCGSINDMNSTICKNCGKGLLGLPSGDVDTDEIHEKADHDGIVEREDSNEPDFDEIGMQQVEDTVTNLALVETDTRPLWLRESTNVNNSNEDAATYELSNDSGYKSYTTIAADTSRIGKVIGKIRTYIVAKKRVIISLIAVVIFIAVLASPVATYARIRYAAAQKDTDTLMVFFQEESLSSSNRNWIVNELMSFNEEVPLEKLLDTYNLSPGINESQRETITKELIGLKQPEGLKKVEAYYLDNTSDSDYKILIAETVLVDGLKFDQGRDLYNYYQTGPSGLQNYTKDLLEKSDSPEQIESYIINDVTGGQKDYASLIKFTNDLVPIKIADVKNTIGSHLVDNLHSDAKKMNLDEANSILNTLSTLELAPKDKIDVATKAIGAYKDLLSQKDALSNTISGIQSTIDNLQSQQQQLQKAVDDSSWFTLEAYIVGVAGTNRYEISMPQYTLYGRLPSSNHAILETSSTSFSSKGWFTIPVHNMGTQDVTLNQDNGGFTQKWKIYEEISLAEQREYDGDTAKLNDVNSQLNALESSKNSNQSKLDSLGNQLDAKEKEVVNFLTAFTLDKQITETPSKDVAVIQTKIPDNTYTGPKVNIGQQVGSGMFEFISNAENTYRKILHSTDSHDTPISIGDKYYLKLMPPYDKPGEIQKYFEKYWSSDISERMYKNLGFKTLNNICYTVVGDPPAYSMLEGKTIYTDQKDNVITIDALYRSVEERTGSHKITYKLKWVGDNWIIIERNLENPSDSQWLGFPYE